MQHLHGASVDFIVIGELAGAAHGLARATYDIAVGYARDVANLRRIVTALEPVHPYVRGAPPGLPFCWDIDTLQRGLNFTLTTDTGAIDFLGEIAGAGNYYELLPHTTEEELFGVRCRCASLPALIRMKRAAGRPKDNEVNAELEALLDESRKRSHDASDRPR